MCTHGTGSVTKQRRPSTLPEQRVIGQGRMTASDFIAVMLGTVLVASLVIYTCLRDSRGMDGIPTQLALPMRP